MDQAGMRRFVLGMAAAAVCVTGIAAGAQERDAVPTGPAPILVTVREMLKPGEELQHAELEAEYTSALDAAKANQYFLGMGAITGSEESVFLSGYTSLEEMAAVHDADEALLGPKLDQLEMAHSGTLSGTDTAIWRLSPGLSNPGTDNLAKMRYMELVHIHVKLGRAPEFEEISREIKQGWLKADPDFHYSVYRQILGNGTDNSYLILIPVRSLADMDKHHSMSAAYEKGVGADLEKRIREVESTDYLSDVSNLFVFTPSMSRLPESWTKQDTDFWKPKPVAAAPAKRTTPATK